MKYGSKKFKSEGLHEKPVVATWSLGNYLSICFFYSNATMKSVVLFVISWYYYLFQILVH